MMSMRSMPGLPHTFPTARVELSTAVITSHSLDISMEDCGGDNNTSLRGRLLVWSL